VSPQKSAREHYSTMAQSIDILDFFSVSHFIALLAFREGDDSRSEETAAKVQSRNTG
jgi:hypothetical protein